MLIFHNTNCLCKKKKKKKPTLNIGRTVAEAEASILWLHDAKSKLTGKYLDDVKD